MYTVLGSNKSRAMRVLWALEELGQPYSYVPCAPRSDEVQALNPSGKIPVLLDGDLVLTDSTGILSYLADKHGQLTAPAGSPQRGLQDCVMQSVLDEIEGLVWTAARHSFVLPEDERVPEIKPSLRKEFSRNVARLADRVQGPYLMGDALTIADIVTVHCLMWAQLAKFEVTDPRLLAYVGSAMERPAFQKAAAL